jgi:hypothetical protein
MTEFIDQLSGSASANGLTALVFLLIWIIRNKCKHSKCTGHSICCDIEISEDTINDESSEDPERGECIPPKTEEDVYTLHTPKHSSLPKKRETPV